MTTVKEFKDLGVEFVFGDIVDDSLSNDGSDLKPLSALTAVACNDGRYQFDEAKVGGFAWRPIATLPESPKFKFERNRSAQESNTVWRPLLDQPKQPENYEGCTANNTGEGFVIKYNEYGSYKVKVDADIPVFTQAMAEAGVLPQVGSECSFLWSDMEKDSDVNQDRTLKVIAYNEDMTTIWAKMNGNKDSNLYSLNLLVLKPIDNRTPKQKAVDTAMEDIDAENDDVANVVGVIERMIAAGYKKC